jgi:hypothetical protein
LTGQDIGDVLLDSIDLTLPSILEPLESERPITTLTDDEILALTELQLPSSTDERLSDLLYLQQAGTMTDSERSELNALMLVYKRGLLRKAQALAEAVRRGLREPLSG